jgi:hypothetical protein
VITYFPLYLAMFCSEECKERLDFHSEECKSFKLDQSIIDLVKLDYYSGRVYARALSVFNGSSTDMKRFVRAFQLSKDKFCCLDLDWNSTDARGFERNHFMLALGAAPYILSFLMGDIPIVKVFSDPVQEIHSVFYGSGPSDIRFKGEGRTKKKLMPHLFFNYYGEVYDPFFRLGGKSNVLSLQVMNKIVSMVTCNIKAGTVINAGAHIGHLTDAVIPLAVTHMKDFGYLYGHFHPSALSMMPGNISDYSEQYETPMEHLMLNAYGRDSCCSKPSGMKYVEKTSKVEAMEALIKNCAEFKKLEDQCLFQGFFGQLPSLDDVRNLEVLKKPASFYP